MVIIWGLDLDTE